MDVCIGVKPIEDKWNISYSNLETEYLFRTIKNFGGTLSKSEQIACFSNTPNKELEGILTGIGIEIKLVDHIDERNPLTDKIRVVEEGSKKNTDFIVYLDTDTLVTNDFSDFLDPSKILIKPEDRDTFSISEWKDLFDYYGLDLPSDRYSTTCSPNKTIPYFNSGVLLIPQNLSSELFKNWKNFTHRILDDQEDFPLNIKQNMYYTDQISLTLALAESKLPYGPLPLKMNYPFSGKVNQNENPELLYPNIIHHHHCIHESGKIMHCPYSNINQIIDNINKVLGLERKYVIDEQSMKLLPITIRNLTMMHNFDKVIERLSELSIDDTNPYLQYYLALSLHHKGIRLDEALTRYSVALENGFDVFVTLAGRGKLQTELGNIDEGKNDLNKAHLMRPYDKDILKKIASIDSRVILIQKLSDEFKFDEVIERLSELSIDDTNPYLQYYLALSLHHKGIRLDEALTRYSVALENGFDIFWIYFQRGSLFILLNRKKEAEGDLQKALEFNQFTEEIELKIRSCKL